ncbi:TAM domain methyltransferase [Colletotrichum abscissum]|uniref:TAM domain methyltransferase n=1 Tax=Colletotrichum abscissum TaxID=1671311 RepID=A0A9P9X0E8_9PEZI|nr:TAM domain methyltransferase [Colletotrichum abscissum]
MCEDNTGNNAAADANAQPDHEVILLAEDEQSDTSSEIGSSVASSSASVSSSILDYRLENGRTYHKYKDGKYWFPNDERENDRLDLQHNLFILTFDDRLATAPPNEPDAKVGKVLDVGTGSGIWAIDFGEEHPDAEVFGFRYSILTIKYSVPPNVKFEIDDIEQPWTFSHSFDYIHSRMMNSSLKDWNAYIKTCYDNLEPGGYLELNEIDVIPTSDDGTLKPESAISRSAKLLHDAGEIIGRPFLEMSSLKDVLINTGFEDVHRQLYKWPTNSWPKHERYKELGIWNHENLVAGWEGFCMAPFTRVHGWSKEEVIVFMAEIRKEFQDRSIHAYFKIWSIYGRKPLQSETTETA